jgi:hypothetical protein
MKKTCFASALAITMMSASAFALSPSSRPAQAQARPDESMASLDAAVYTLGGVCFRDLTGCTDGAQAVNFLSTSKVLVSSNCIGADYNSCDYQHPYHLKTTMVVLDP